MSISRLVVNQLRNIDQMELYPSPQVNLIVGANGSGKTSLLEAIYLLGRARSFKTQKQRSFIQYGQEEAVIFGEIRPLENTSVINAGVKKSIDGGQAIKVSGTTLTSAAPLLELLPVQLIEPDTFTVLSGGPSIRRQFIDWGVFHVEHSFYPLWQQLNRSLKQRNNLLRRGKIDCSVLAVWDREFVEKAQAISGLRQNYVEQLMPVFQDMMAKLSSDIGDVELSFYQGWKAGVELATVLDEQHEIDCKRGFTHSGPQRADLRVKHLRQMAGEVLSRGQQKLVICALKIAQGYLFSRETGRACIYLLDDLAAELDVEHRNRLCGLLATLNCQLFVTSINQETFASNWKGMDVKVFHVEQGALIESSA